MSGSTAGGITGFVLVNSSVIVLGGQGVNDIAVTLTNLNGNPVTDASGALVTPVLTAQYGNYLQGRFAFTNIPDGEYALELPPNATLASSTGGRYLVSINSESDQNFLAVDVNAAFTQPTDVSSAIEGFVYIDTNQDGAQDNGETAAGGQLIELANAGGTVVDVTTASATGIFGFTGLTPGNYTLSTAGINISQEPTGGIIALTSGETAANATIGVYQHSISGFAFNDANGDGIQDRGETAFAGQTISLLNTTGTVIATTTTDGQGDFSFGGLNPGTYSFSNSGGQTVALGAGSVSHVTLAAYTPATITGLIFLDENDDGLFEVTPQGTDPDLGTGGITVDFINAEGEIAGSATSSFGGPFTSTPLAPGTYTLANPSAGILSGPSLHIVTVTEGETLSALDIGIYEPNSIAVPSIFIDTNFDGNDDGAIDNFTASSAEPVTVTLLNQQGAIATDLAGNLQVQTLTSGVLQEQTQQFGPYSVTTPAVTFNNLAPGDYSVEVSAPGYQSEQGVYPIGAELETAGLPEQPATAVQPIALFQIGTGVTITGTVYGGGQGIAGATVCLLENNNGTPVVEQTVDTNANGQYSFAGLGAGNAYEIDFGTPTGYSATTPVLNVPVTGPGALGSIAGPSAEFTLAAAPGTVGASQTLNIVMIGQSNAALFSGNGYLTRLTQNIEQDLGFNGTSQVVNLIVQPGPGDSASNNFSSGPATEFGGTALTTDWLTPNNGNEADGWTSGTNEDGVYSEMNALLTYLAQTAASDPGLSTEPTVILDLHNESDVENPDLNTSIWVSAVQFEASAVRAVLGQTAAQAPYAFVNAIPFPEEPISTATQAQVDENEQAVRIGMASLASNPAFNAIVAAQISDVDQNFEADGDGGWHLSSNSTINGNGQVVALQTNPQTGAAYDDDTLEQRLAASLADEFSASALPGSEVANALAAGALLDDTGPLVTAAATVTGSPDQLLLTVQQFDSAIGFDTTLSTDAKAGVGWSLRTAATGANSQLVATGTAATIISPTQLLVSFDAPVPAAAAGDLLFYAWGGERIAQAGTPASGLSSNYDGTTYPGEGAAIYDTAGEPIHVNPAGILIGAAPTACFAAGTRIVSATGALVAVETLRIGDQLKLASGGAAPVKWIGRRALDLRRHSHPQTVQPVCFAAGALGNGLPAQNLLVSPDHAFFLQGHLIPAKALLNGFTIRQLQRTRVTYYHVELPAHAVILAEGAAVETYLDTGNRSAFDNAGPSLTLHPDFAQRLRDSNACAPFAESGPAVEAARQAILDRAGIETTADPALRIIYENGAAIITSHAAIPGEIFADPRDRRRLGVKIKSLSAGRKKIPLDHPALTEGWHAPEPDGRWTNGAAIIPAPLLAGRKLHLTLAATLRYPTTDQPRQAAAPKNPRPVWWVAPTRAQRGTA